MYLYYICSLTNIVNKLIIIITIKITIILKAKHEHNLSYSKFICVCLTDVPLALTAEQYSSRQVLNSMETDGTSDRPSSGDVINSRPSNSDTTAVTIISPSTTIE